MERLFNVNVWIVIGITEIVARWWWDGWWWRIKVIKLTQCHNITFHGAAVRTVRVSKVQVGVTALVLQLEITLRSRSIARQVVGPVGQIAGLIVAVENVVLALEGVDRRVNRVTLTFVIVFTASFITRMHNRRQALAVNWWRWRFGSFVSHFFTF